MPPLRHGRYCAPSLRGPSLMHARPPAVPAWALLRYCAMAWGSGCAACRTTYCTSQRSYERVAALPAAPPLPRQRHPALLLLPQDGHSALLLRSAEPAREPACRG